MDIPETPGPTSYARTLTRTIEKPRIDTAFGHRSGRVTYDINDVPGPGAYLKEDKWVTRRKSTIPKGASPDYFTVQDTPGPGQYETSVKRKIEDRPNSSFASRSKRELRKINSNPGPGDYDPEIPGDNDKISIVIKEAAGKDAWIEPSKLGNPAPNQYQKLETEYRPLTIPKQGRFDDKPSDTPGPGKYNVKHGSFIIPSHNSRASRKTDDDL